MSTPEPEQAGEDPRPDAALGPDKPSPSLRERMTDLLSPGMVERAPREDSWVEEKVQSAEENIGLVRVTLIGLTTFVYLALMDPADSIVWLASGVIGISIPYALYVWLVKPYRRTSILQEGRVLATIDGILVGGWVLSTGGFESPLFVLWYPAIAAVAYRFDLKDISLHAFGYSALYLAVLGASGDLPGHGAALTMRIAMIPLVGVIGGLFSEEYFNQVRARYSARDQLRQERMDAIEDAHEVVRDQEKRWRSILTNTPGHIMVVSRDGRIEYANRELDGTLRDDLIGTNVREHVPAPFRDDLEDGLKAALQEGEVDEFQVMMPGSDDEPRWYNARIGPITWAGGIQGAAIITTDITERKEAEEEMAAYARQVAEHANELERSNAELAHYAELAAHDLQEPLRDITHYTQMLERRYADELDDEAQEFLAFTVDGAKRMHMLLSELLHYSQLRSSSMDLQACEVQTILDRATTTVEEEGPRPEIVVDGELPTVLADPARLQDVFKHLLINAIRYNEHERPRIEVGAERDGDRWRLHIRDDGIGIDPRYHDRIFDPFRRLHTRQAYPGAGIGLSICRRIIEAHGGRIWVDSQDSGGSTFYITLPPAASTRDAEAQIDQAPPGQAGRAPPPPEFEGEPGSGT